MSHLVACYRCGTSLAHLSLPLSRQDSCPSCHAHLHVCRMCRSFDVSAHDQCLEDDAERVREKEQLNFCDYFVAAEGAFDASGQAAADAARAELDALFDGGESTDKSGDDPDLAAADDLFK